MSHEIENREGKDSFFEVGALRSAWHQLGELLATAPRSVEELFTVAPWLNYPVVKNPTTLVGVLDKDGNPMQSAKAFVTLRTDTNKELGSVGPDYSVVQNRTAIERTIGPLIDKGVLAIETGGVLRDGADAWVLGRFNLDQFGPVVREVFADEIVPYGLIAVNHAGRRNNTLALTPIRVVCANTLGMAEQEIDGGRSKAVSIRHTGDAEKKMIEAAEALFGGIIERYETIAKQYRAMKGAILDEALFASLVLLPAIGLHPTQRREFNPEAKLAERTIERYEKRRDTITWLWEKGAGHVGDQSAWEAYNGLVEAIDHNEDIFPARSGVYRLGSLLDGDLRKKKDMVLHRLAAFSEAQGTTEWEQTIVEAADRAALVLAK